MDKLLGMPPNVSAHGGEIDWLMMVIHVFMLILFIGWSAFFIYILVRFRSSKNKVGDYAGVKSPFSKYVEVAVALIEAVLLIAFSVPMYAKRVQDFPDEKSSVVIHAVAEQFAWNFHYPGADGIFGKRDIKLIDPANPVGLDRSSEGGADDIVKVNQLHVPTGKPVIIHLTSKDVIHCFSLPVMRIKQDIIPGMSIPIWFEAVQTIESEINCAQLCGLGHYRMKGFLTVETMDEYNAWLEEEAKAIQSSEDDDFWE